MQFSALLTTAALALPTLISATACVAGGPAWEVTAAGRCCHAYGGTLYQFYPVQAICVVSDDKTITDGYNACVSRIGGSPPLDTKCIPGTGGLSPNPTGGDVTTRVTLFPTTLVAVPTDAA